MNTSQLLMHGWIWSPVVILCGIAALALYLAAFGAQQRTWYFVAAAAVVFLALLSPVGTLADGYLFSAHMFQHMLLLLIAPALLVLSLPRSLAMPAMLRKLLHPVAGWVAGVGSMWVWHMPALCNAAARSQSVFTLQTVSLLTLGTVFWWQVIAPRDAERLPPFNAITYLFSACVACSVLGIIITFSPVSICSAYLQPADRLGLLSTIRRDWSISTVRDQQIGGLLMWVPMCAIYLTAILVQLGRLFHPPEPAIAHAHGGKI